MVGDEARLRPWDFRLRLRLRRDKSPWQASSEIASPTSRLARARLRMRLRRGKRSRGGRWRETRPGLPGRSSQPQVCAREEPGLPGRSRGGRWRGTEPGFALRATPWQASSETASPASLACQGVVRNAVSNEAWWSRRGRHCGPAAECGRSRGGRRPAGAGRRGGRAAYGHPLVGRRPIPGQGAECARTPALVGSE